MTLQLAGEPGLIPLRVPGINDLTSRNLFEHIPRLLTPQCLLNDTIAAALGWHGSGNFDPV